MSFTSLNKQHHIARTLVRTFSELWCSSTKLDRSEIGCCGMVIDSRNYREVKRRKWVLINCPSCHSPHCSWDNCYTNIPSRFTIIMAPLHMEKLRRFGLHWWACTRLSAFWYQRFPLAIGFFTFIRATAASKDILCKTVT